VKKNLNQDCLIALREYWDPESKLYKKGFQLVYIQENFKKKDIEECELEIRGGIKWGGRTHNADDIIERHAKGVEKGEYNTGIPYYRSKTGKKITIPPKPTYKSQFELVEEKQKQKLLYLKKHKSVPYVNYRDGTNKKPKLFYDAEKDTHFSYTSEEELKNAIKNDIQNNSKKIIFRSPTTGKQIVRTKNKYHELLQAYRKELEDK